MYIYKIYRIDQVITRLASSFFKSVREIDPFAFRPRFVRKLTATIIINNAISLEITRDIKKTRGENVFFFCFFVFYVVTFFYQLVYCMGTLKYDIIFKYDFTVPPGQDVTCRNTNSLAVCSYSGGHTRIETKTE